MQTVPDNRKEELRTKKPQEFLKEFGLTWWQEQNPDYLLEKPEELLTIFKK